MKNKILILIIATVLLASLSISLASADQIEWLCLDKSQTVEFSLCNPAIADRTCDSNLGCRYCVNHKTNGVYCPADINTCNSIQNLECSSLGQNVTGNGTSGNNSTNSTNQTIPGNSTNGTINNSTNQTHNTAPPIVISPVINLHGMKVAYIVKDIGRPEKNVVNALNESGYDYELIDDDSLPSMNLSRYDIFLVWDERINNENFVPIHSMKTFIGNTYYLKDWKIAESAGSQTNSQYALGKIINSSSMIISGFTSPIKLYNKTSTELNFIPNFPKKARGVQNILSTNDANNYVVIGLIDKKSALYPSTAGNSSAKTVFFGITQAAYWTNESKNLFKNSMAWLSYGEDIDGDGFFSESDCNDRNSDVHPGTIEVPYDGIDQNCDGKDLIDVDFDGFNSTIVGGNDCDDLDDEINIDNPNPSLNCVNDAPLLDSMDNLVYQEGDIVRITSSASDYENNSITYSINSTKFTKSGNVFSWQTGYDDAGEYMFKVTASDGSLNSSENVLVEVADINRAPSAAFIPNATWNEDSNFSLNLSSYFSDLDDDNLTYDVENTSTNQHNHVFINGSIAFFWADEDWNGEDWIEFNANDGELEAVSNRISIKVNSINDAPTLENNISGVNWSEDARLNNALDLNDYFGDIDSTLNYSVIGNVHANVTITNGMASFSSEKDWFGSESVRFRATDGQFSVDSNLVNLNVADSGEPPVFLNLSCPTSVNEDQEYNCELNATDIENDSVTFLPGTEINLECDVSGNTLVYKSVLNYNGNGSCQLIARDKDGDGEIILNVNVLAVNDAPTIDSADPNGNVRLVRGVNQTFNVVTSDVDSNITNSWYLNGNLSGNGSSYLFNNSFDGSYNLTVVVSDGLLNTVREWIVFVGDISEFTCSEVGGDICSADEICEESLLGVKDSNLCCSIACSPIPPKFDDADSCIIANSSVKVEIDSPDNNESFELGDTIKVDIKVTNNLHDRESFDVEAHLYDLTDDESVNSAEDSLSVSAGNGDDLTLDIVIPEDLDIEDKVFAIFVKADGEVCNQEYIEVSLERLRNKIAITEFSAGDDICAGESVQLDLIIDNLGTTSQDVSLKIENSDLEISQSNSFRLEKFGQDDRERKNIIIQIPNEAREGEYVLRATASYASTRTIADRSIRVEECNPESNSLDEQELSDEEEINLNPLGAISENSSVGSVAILLMLSIAILAVIFLIILYMNYSYIE